MQIIASKRQIKKQIWSNQHTHIWILNISKESLMHNIINNAVSYLGVSVDFYHSI